MKANYKTLIVGGALAALISRLREVGLFKRAEAEDSGTRFVEYVSPDGAKTVVLRIIHLDGDVLGWEALVPPAIGNSAQATTDAVVAYLGAQGDVLDAGARGARG